LCFDFKTSRYVSLICCAGKDLVKTWCADTNKQRKNPTLGVLYSPFQTIEFIGIQQA